MSDLELIDLLKSKKWTEEMRTSLIEEWNSRRLGVQKIGANSVRTPCRLRQIIQSFTIFLDGK